MLFDPAPGVLSLDALHGEEYAKAQQEVYEQARKGPYGSPGMLMGPVSYASIVSQEELKSTISGIRANSLAKTKFEKAQEEAQRASLTLLCTANALLPAHYRTAVGFNFRQPPDILHPLPARHKRRE